jgi:F420H(2)-dependent quinone reductase
MARSFFRFLMKFFMAIGITLYTTSGGKIGGRISGLEVLLLTTRGRKTGKQRTTPLGYFKDQEGSYVIIGSNAGFDTHPAWFYNLKSQPHVTIQVKEKQLEVDAEVAGSDKRNQLWKQLVKLAPFYGNYEKKTDRKIPVVILHPVHA